MGRPKLPAEKRRDCSTRADLTVAEKAELARKAKLAGMSEAELLRRLITDGRVIVQGGGAADPALITELNRLALQLKYVGVTANKLAISTHTGRKFRGQWEYVAREIDAVRQQAGEALKRVV